MNGTIDLEEAEQLRSARPFEDFEGDRGRSVSANSMPEPKFPPGFKMREQGLVWTDPGDNEKPPVHIAGRFDVIAESRDEAGWSWGVLLRWRDPDGREREWAMPRSILAGDGTEARRALLDGGLYVGSGTKARNLLTQFLTSVHVEQRAKAVSAIGWYGSAYVFPDGAIGKTGGERSILQTSGAFEHAYYEKGTLAEWQDNVARYAIGNSRLLLAISTAFAAAIVRTMRGGSRRHPSSRPIFNRQDHCACNGGQCLGRRCA